MSSDLYGQSGKDHHVRQWILARLNKNDEQLPLTEPSTSRSPTWQEQRYMSQDSPQSYQDVSQHQDDQMSQHLHSKSNQTLRQEDQMTLTYSHQGAFSMPQDYRSQSSPSLDDQSLYCTEILPSASPPSHPVAVERGGTSRPNLLGVSGGINSQPVQYTIIITDPQLHQASSSNNNVNTTSGATNLLLNTLVQQQQQDQQLHLQQQQLQQHFATISKGNSNINNLITGAANTNIILNNNSINGSNKLGSLLICSNNNNFTSESGIVSSTSAFPATFIANSQSSPFSEGKNIHLTKVTLSANNKLPAAVLDNGSIEGGIVILNYTDPLLTAGSSITNINQLVSVHGRVPNTLNLDKHSTGQQLTKAVSNNNTVISASRGVVASSNVNVSNSSDVSQINFRTGASSGNSVAFNGQTFVNEEKSGELTNSENSISHISQQLSFSAEQQILESNSSAVRVCGGMHSGNSGSGQAHNCLSLQQQLHIPVSSSSSPSVSATTVNQLTMLSAGQPAVPSCIFRTGTDNTTSAQRLSASGSTSYVSAQYPSVYGIHSQTTGHLSTLQPYSTFVPGFGGSGTSRHRSSHGPVMTGTTQANYPHIESYSAMLASMGSHVQHRGTQEAERTPRASAPGVSVTQHTSSFLPLAHLTAPGIQYSNITPTSLHQSSGSSSSSSGLATTHASSSASTHLEPLPSHCLENVTTNKGGSSLQSREGELSRERIIYGDTSNLHEDKPSQGNYCAGSHIPKVSFDSVVKEYGGSRDSPTGRSDIHFRTSLSGKEGSLKHRILTRPSESDITEDHTRVSGVHGLKDEPLSKRPKMNHVGGSAATAYSSKSSQEHHSDSQRSSNHCHPISQTSHNLQPDSNNMLEGSGISSRHANDNLNLHENQHPSLFQHCHSEATSSDIKYEQSCYYTSPASEASPTSPSSDSAPSHIQYPTHFMKGSIIQLANGTLKRVEDLQTEDFVSSAEISSDLKVDSSTVVRIEEQLDRGTAMLSFSVGEHRVQVTVEATLEHPFFVFGQGWSSCSVSRTLARYGLDCQRLNVGDVCISLTHKDVNLKAAEIGQQQQKQTCLTDNKLTMTGTASAEHQSPQSTSSLTVPSSGVPPSALASHVKSENIVPFQPSSTSVDKHQLPQTDLPPPLSNIVLVKKENNGHTSHRKSLQRVEEELVEDKVFEEDDQSDSTMSLRKRRWSAPDTSCVKIDPEQGSDQQLLVSAAQTT